LNYKKKITPILKKNGVVKASFFGSFARGEDKPDSDIDLLVDFPDKSLLDMIHLKNELEDFLGRKVDVITYNSINPRIENYIYQDEVKIYGKG
jgi:predicted nucleotidyltransferase